MQAFHNDEKIKKKYVNRVLAHQKADEIIKGKYWSKGKGCAVGCTIHSGEHKAYETELGIPQWLARLEDTIFEGLLNERAMAWPAEFLKAIKPGQDLEKIKIPMLIFIVESARENFNHEKYPKQLIAIDNILYELRKDFLDFEALKKARSVAADAAYAAYAAYAAADAAYAAADAAYAAYAAYAADAADAAAYAAADAAYAAYAAAYAADAADAAAYAAKENAYVKFADKILELIRAQQ